MFFQRITPQATGWMKFILIAACAVHTGFLVFGMFSGQLGPNPIETLTHTTGDWALYWLLAGLAVTPLRRLFHWNWLIRLRRVMGLCCFYYVSLHLLIYLVFDHFFDWVGIWEDIVERPYITIGFAAFLLLLPLAVTSVDRLQRSMGLWWLRLHKLVYPAAIMVIIHYWWLVKSDIFWPLIYGIILSILFLVRVYFSYRKRFSH